MAVTTATRREFCRRLFRVGASSSLRHATLDALSDTAIAAQQSGSAIQSTASNGSTVTFQFFAGWSPDDALVLINEARSWADAADLAAALALIMGPVTSYGTDFTNLGGGAPL